MEFEEIQALWLRQVEPGASPERARAIVDTLSRAERAQARRVLIKAGAAAAILVPAAAWLLVAAVSMRPRFSMTFAGAALWCILAVAVVLIVVWRTRFRVRRLDFTQPSKSFALSVTRQLQRQQVALRLSTGILAACLVIGLNVMLIGLNGERSAPRRAVEHAAATALPGVAVLLARRFAVADAPLLFTDDDER